MSNDLVELQKVEGEKKEQGRSSNVPKMLVTQDNVLCLHARAPKVVPGYFAASRYILFSLTHAHTLAYTTYTFTTYTPHDTGSC